MKIAASTPTATAPARVQTSQDLPAASVDTAELGATRERSIDWGKIGKAAAAGAGFGALGAGIGTVAQGMDGSAIGTSAATMGLVSAGAGFLKAANAGMDTPFNAFQSTVAVAVPGGSSIAANPLGLGLTAGMAGSVAGAGLGLMGAHGPAMIGAAAVAGAVFNAGVALVSQRQG